MRLAGELRALLRLGGPLVVANVSVMLGGVATTMMLGRLGPEAVGIQGLATILFFNVAILGLDLLLGLDFLVSKAVGAGRLDEANAFLVQGWWAAIGATVVVIAVHRLGLPLLGHFDLNPAIFPEAMAYVRIASLSVLPMMFTAATHRYLQARGLTRPVMLIMLSGLVVELVAKWALIFGEFGAPAFGALGAAWGAAIELYWVAITSVAFLAWQERRAPSGLAAALGGPVWSRLHELIRLGAPASVRSAAEVGLIAAATTLAARLDAISLAAHQITLNVASLTFMVPLGLSAGAAVRVGHLVGSGDARGARYAGWVAIGATAVIMLVMAAALLGLRAEIMAAYTTDAAVVFAGLPLFVCAGLFQLGDGVQVVATGTMRGAGDTRTPLVLNLLVHWVVAVPLAWWLCFRGGWGVLGLWIGLAVGLILVGAALLIAWAGRARRLAGRSG